MSNFSIKQLYVLYKPAASVRARYKSIHYMAYMPKKSQRIFLSIDIVSFCFYTAAMHETWTKHKLLR